MPSSPARPSRRVVGLAVVVLASLTLAACGDDEPKSSGTPSGTSTGSGLQGNALRDRVDALCRDRDEKLDLLDEPDAAVIAQDADVA
ncbi:MAG: hypothetical protein M0P31_06050 [Solirubrobacteraceae bacterium]|nr:hypothetical protein [Solirubrobacteraceae bacterium]